MPIGTASGLGGGGGFTLGPAQNVFTGGNRTVAEAARDAYQTDPANSAWLPQYNTNRSLNIRLEYDEGDNSVVLYQVRNSAGDQWLDNESFEGVQGRPGVDGNNYEFVDAASRDAFFQARPDLLVANLPVIIAVNNSTIMNEIWRGADRPSSYNPTTDSIFFIPASVMAGTASFFLGGIHQISSSGENVTFRNTDSDVNYFPPWQFVGDHREETGRVVGSRPNGRSYGALTMEEPSGAAATTGSVPYDVTFTLPRNESVFGVKVVPAEAYTGSIEYRITRMETVVVSYNQFMDVATTVGTELELWFPFPTEGSLGTQVTAEIYKSDGTLLQVRPLESDNALAYTEIRFREYTDMPLAYTADEFNFSSRAMVLNAANTINDINFDSFEGQFLYVPASLGSTEAVLTIEADSELTGLDLIALHTGGLRLVAGTGVLINGQASITLARQYQGGRLIVDPTNANNFIFLYDANMSDPTVLRTAGETVTLLEGLSGDDRLDASAIKNLPADVDNYADTLTGSLSGNELTITVGRTGALGDLTTMIDLSSIAPDNPTPTGGPDSLYYGLSSTDNPATVDLGTLTLIDPNDPQTVSTGTTSQGDYFIILSANTHPVTSITDTVLSQDVTDIFVSTDDVRTEGAVTYDSYVIGPLNADVSESYVLEF